MKIDIKECDLNNGYYHFTNIDNIKSIMDTGLQPSVGLASKVVVIDQMFQFLKVEKVS